MMGIMYTCRGSRVHVDTYTVETNAAIDTLRKLRRQFVRARAKANAMHHYNHWDVAIEMIDKQIKERG